MEGWAAGRTCKRQLAKPAFWRCCSNQTSSISMTQVQATLPFTARPRSRSNNGPQRRSPEQLLSSICRYANAVDIARGGSLASLPPNLKLSELSRHLRELTALFCSQDAPYVTDAIQRSPQAHAALVQLQAAALCFAADPCVQAHSSTAVTSSLGLAAAQAAAGAAGAASTGASTSSAAGRKGGMRGSAGQTGKGAAVEERASALLLDASRASMAFMTQLFAECEPGLSGAARVRQTLRPAKEHVSLLLDVQTLPALARFLAAAASRGRSRPQSAPISIDEAEVVYKIFSTMSWTAEDDQGFLLKVMHILSSSSLLEHLAKAAAPRAGAAAAAAAAATATTSTASTAAPKPMPSSSAGDSPRVRLQEAMLHTTILLPSTANPPASMRPVLSGPCLQYFMSAFLVSQLHAADGGPLYGLPYDALMPPLAAEEEEPPVPRTGRQQQRRQGQQRPLMAASGFVAPLSIWRLCLSLQPPVLLDPLRPRHLVALCLRTARFTLDSWDVHEEQGRILKQQQQQQQQAACSGSEGAGKGGEANLQGRPLRWLLEPGPCAGMVLLKSLELSAMVLCGPESAGAGGARTTGTGSGGDSGSGGGGGVSTGCVHAGSGSSQSAAATPPAARPDPRLHHAPSAARWWPLAVQSVRTMLRRDIGSALSASLLPRLCLLLQLDGRTKDSELTTWPSPEVVLAAAPPAGLPHALSAGYIPTYEALMRAACRSADLSLPASSASGSVRENVMAEVPARKATRRLRSLVLVAPGSKLLLLLGEGDPREAAALATTLCKAHLQHAELAAKAGSREGLAEAAGMITGLAQTLLCGLCARRGLAEQTAEGSAGATATSGSGGSSDNGDTCDLGGYTGVLSVGPDVQRVRLMSYMLPRLLPVLTRIGALCFAAGLGGTEEVYGLARTRQQVLGRAAQGAAVAEDLCDGDAQESWVRLQANNVGAGQAGAGADDGSSEDAEEGAEAQLASRPGECLGGCDADDKEQQQQWVQVVPHAPYYAVMLLPTCSNPLCLNVCGESEAGVELGVQSVGDGGSEAAARVGGPGQPGHGFRGPEGGGEGSGGQEGCGEGTGRYCSVACLRSHGEQLEYVAMQLRG